MQRIGAARAERRRLASLSSHSIQGTDIGRTLIAVPRFRWNIRVGLEAAPCFRWNIRLGLNTPEIALLRDRGLIRRVDARGRLARIFFGRFPEEHLDGRIDCPDHHFADLDGQLRLDDHRAVLFMPIADIPA